MSATPAAGRLAASLRKLAPGDFFHKNLFRLLELPVSADRAQARKHADLIRHAIKSKIVEARPRGLLPRTRPADEHEVTAALHAFADPSDRLVHELLWFWPLLKGEEQADPALQHFVNGQEDKASGIWLVARSGNGREAVIARHNLAVLQLFKTLELADAGNISEFDRRSDLTRGLLAALESWTAVCSDAALWQEIEERITALGDPTLPLGASQRLRDTVPVVLAYAFGHVAAVQAAVAGSTDMARELINSLRKGAKKLPSTAVEEGIGLAIEPIRNLLSTILSAAEREADADRAQADSVVERLLDRATPKLAIIALMLPPSSQLAGTEFDRIANACAAILTTFANKTKKWKRTLELFERLKPLARGEVTKGRIVDGEKTLQENIDLERCWFCGKNEADAKSDVPVSMHGEVKREWDRLRWSTSKISVPRCKKCAEQAGTLETAGWAAALVGTSVAIMGAYALANRFIWGGPIFGALVGVIFYRVLAITLVGSSKGRRQQSEFPPIKARLRDGWQFGEKPPEAT